MCNDVMNYKILSKYMFPNNTLGEDLDIYSHDRKNLETT